MQKHSLVTVISLFSFAILAACGGGGGGGGGTSSASPDSLSSRSSSSAASSSSSSSSAASSSTASSSSVSSSASSTPEASSSSAASASSAASSAITLNQSSNPVYAELNTYQTLLSTASDSAAKLNADKAKADIILTWQTAEGGFYKHISDSSAGAGTKYSTAWSSGSKSSSWLGENGEDLGTIDNDATTSELFFLADVYKRSGDSKYRSAAQKTLEFLLTMQTNTGGFPQVYPKRAGTSYSNYVTFNDEAMVRVLVTLDHAARLRTPFDGDVFSADQRSRISAAIDKAEAFILKAQIVQNGVKTVWCAQHDPVSYAPLGARAYELPSKSGKESVGIVTFLMSRPQTTEVKAAIQAALSWYRSSATQLKDTYYDKNEAKAYRNPFVTKSGSTTWYRFYDLDQDKGFFSDRTAVKFYNIMEIEQERLAGYEWGGSYGDKLISYANAVGY